MPALHRLSQHPTDERETRAVVGQEGGCGAYVSHRQGFVDDAGEIGVGAVGGHGRMVLHCRQPDLCYFKKPNQHFA